MIENLTDSDLTSMIKDENDESALHELISRHSGIYVDMLKKFGYNSLSFNQISDIMQDKDYVIYKAALEYNPEKAKFSTHLANKTKYMCLTQKTKNKKNLRLVSFEEREEQKKNNQQDRSKRPDENCVFNDSFKRILNLIFKHKDKRVKQIFKMRYGGDRKLTSWKKIAKKLDISIQGCINIHDKAIKEIKSKIENEKIKL